MRVGKWEGLCPGCDYLSSAEKVTQTWMWTNTPKTYGQFKFKIMLPLPQTCVQACVQECSKGRYCQFGKLSQGLLAVVSPLLQFCGNLAIRKTRRWGFYCGTVNVLDAADTDWDSKWRVNKSLHARRISDFLYKVPQHLFLLFS